MVALLPRSQAQAHSKRAQLQMTVLATTYAPLSMWERQRTIIVAQVEVRRC